MSAHAFYGDPGPRAAAASLTTVPRPALLGCSRLQRTTQLPARIAGANAALKGRGVEGKHKVPTAIESPRVMEVWNSFTDADDNIPDCGTSAPRIAANPVIDEGHDCRRGSRLLDSLLNGIRSDAVR
jgi:hypothetical protein